MRYSNENSANNRKLNVNKQSSNGISFGGENQTLLKSQQPTASKLGGIDHITTKPLEDSVENLILSDSGNKSKPYSDHNGRIENLPELP